MNGVIKRVNLEKGYGFIRGSDGMEYFFHKSGLEQATTRFADLGEGMAVAFEAIKGPKGPRAIDVRVTD